MFGFFRRPPNPSCREKFFEERVQQMARICVLLYERNEKMSGVIDELKAGFAELEGKVESLMATHGDKTSALAQAQSENAQLQAENAELTKDVAEFKTQLDALTQKVATLLTPAPAAEAAPTVTGEQTLP